MFQNLILGRPDCKHSDTAVYGQKSLPSLISFPSDFSSFPVLDTEDFRSRGDGNLAHFFKVSLIGDFNIIF